ncbi:MAG: GDP-L-fucose synthase [Parvicella sp.]|jgi:GDP-L-fucose synthase
MELITKEARIFVAGHRGMVGSAIVRCLQQEGYSNVLLKSKSELDLLNTASVDSFFEEENPEIVILAAARVGGILANMSKPADFLYENLVIQNNTIRAANAYGVKKFVFLGSSCIYPRDCPQPMKEEYLLTGKLEPTNEGYSLAKITGIKLLEFYKKQYGLNSISLMPCNLYGTNDSFHPEHSHVLSALVKKFSDAMTNGLSKVELWGTGVARREFMHVDDMARAVLFFMNNYETSEFINVGVGADITIKELAELIAKKVGYTGEILWDHSKPDGMLRKCMDVTKMKELGFEATISIEEGIVRTINEYKNLKNVSI